MKMLETIKQKYQQLQSNNGSSALTPIEQNAFKAFDSLGIPTVKNEEWKYTRISSVFNKEYAFNPESIVSNVNASDLDAIRLPGHENAIELFFINGKYSAEYSNIRSKAIVILPLEDAAKSDYKEIVSQNLGHSSKYINDGIHALNTAFLQEGIFIHIKKGQVIDNPIYIYQVIDSRSVNILSQPRLLIHVAENAQVEFVETFVTLGLSESSTNEVTEFVVEKDAIVEYYKIQNDVAHSNQVNTTHFRQVGKSVVHTVTISLNGGIVRNNLNIVMEAEHSEADLHGLYFLKGQTHVDNHTVVDNVKPHSLSNELYKGIIDDNATAVFNGKIFVQKDAQKTNAFQSNKNILLSENATVNTKPQLEIFADDVKCSHGATTSQIEDSELFYLQARGIGKQVARGLLVYAFAGEIVDRIKFEPLRNKIKQRIGELLKVDL
jgi:Fe-S cluster assembly protein SufD